MMPRLLLLTDRSQLGLGRSLTSTVLACAEAGLTHVVLRELDLTAHQRACLAGRFADAGLTVIAARRPLPGCAGVHLSADASGPAPQGRTVGRSCHTRAEVTAAAEEGVDYVTLGPWAPTPSKPGYSPTLAPADYACLPVPVFALGGITPATAADAVAAGAHGVAVMGAVMRSDDPGAVVRSLLGAVA